MPKYQVKGEDLPISGFVIGQGIELIKWVIIAAALALLIAGLYSAYTDDPSSVLYVWAEIKSMSSHVATCLKWMVSRGNP